MFHDIVYLFLYIYQLKLIIQIVLFVYGLIMSQTPSEQLLQNCVNDSEFTYVQCVSNLQSGFSNAKRGITKS